MAPLADMKEALRAMPAAWRQLVRRLLDELEQEDRAAMAAAASASQSSPTPQQHEPVQSESGRRSGFCCGLPCQECWYGTCNRNKPGHTHHTCTKCQRAG